MLLASLFAIAAAVALGVFVSSWQRHGAALRALRGELKACAPLREVRYTVITTEVRVAQPHTAGARVYRPDFTRSRSRRSARHAA